MWALASLGAVEARIPPGLCTSDQSSELHFEAAVAQRAFKVRLASLRYGRSFCDAVRMV